MYTTLILYFRQPTYFPTLSCYGYQRIFIVLVVVETKNRYNGFYVDQKSGNDVVDEFTKMKSFTSLMESFHSLTSTFIVH